MYITIQIRVQINALYTTPSSCRPWAAEKKCLPVSTSIYDDWQRRRWRRHSINVHYFVLDSETTRRIVLCRFWKGNFRGALLVSKEQMRLGNKFQCMKKKRKKQRITNSHLKNSAHGRNNKMRKPGSSPLYDIIFVSCRAKRQWENIYDVIN